MRICKEETRQYKAKWDRENRERNKINQRKRRARLKNIEFQEEAERECVIDISIIRGQRKLQKMMKAGTL